MPKLEIYKNLFLDKIGKNFTNLEISELLEPFKAEFDGFDESSGKIKIEFNDTNRPDLWSYLGLARQIKTYFFGEMPYYDFFSKKGDFKKFYGEILVDGKMSQIRPFIFGFLAKGLIINDKMLETLIQFQEKLCQNYGQKRRRIAMGMYNSNFIKFPISYIASSPNHKFVPLGMDYELSLLEINEKHPKGLEYSHIIKNFDKFPLLLDDNNNVVSYPPIINSNNIGSLKVGDTDLFVEVTGIDFEATLLALSIAACDFYDMGFEILPVKTVFREPFNLDFKELVCPYYFQEEVEFNVENINRLLGSNLTLERICLSLKKMGVNSYSKDFKNHIIPPFYRNDFLHEVDVIEDVMIGEGLSSFNPELPRAFAVGRLSPLEEFSRNVRNLMVGMGFQEMIYNYMGSKKDFIDRMNINDQNFLKVSNPMTENYEYIRASIIPNLLKSESVSSNFPYPHKIFEIGKVALKNLDTTEGTSTFTNLSFLMSGKEISFNEINSIVATLFYYLNIEINLIESKTTFYINGRGADIVIEGFNIGGFGEISPYVLNNFGIFIPCSVFEVNINKLMSRS
ncbi:phenylalanine--tRNA ligase subunit beta [Borreliella burgdorferi]|uniref:phenylalanine--tRNA ligase subunit beta n=1 Tax=Borreliella burgdorferi TaxID=139 RepID=UPI00016B307A|nr:phenylalanine--tRNA ligase subunit beta [Borreliella burgdorferi]EEC21552.1 phenylalanyl-tRNA synthetase, beta subunit [Borreliella burgdorferi 156a]MCD2331525.1 phenylalanine--tRNA ligase subunit beta [Borreliella burgdorferi]MCD2408071.1 phenylalanine--tRNA ligase subunit beta [Borreliella burgdorferi]MCR8908949.1 phenylalanine--tRNA ligase subunit beta [Borreliella burgdorferi 297]MDK7382957.1 phenylalanine--tRNA ligase subunit beta [Borreliella burgdorferi]